MYKPIKSEANELKSKTIDKNLLIESKSLYNIHK